MKKMARLSLLTIGTIGAVAGHAHAGNFQISSPSLKEGASMTSAQVYNGFGCSGENISPEISWKEAPSGTKFYAVTAYDPDAPTGSGWWHWMVINIPANVTKLEEGAGASDKTLPAGAQHITTDYGTASYGGACPPKGDRPHRYEFTVYALKDKITVDKNATAAMAGFMINSQKPRKTHITVTYSQ